MMIEQERKAAKSTKYTWFRGARYFRTVRAVKGASGRFLDVCGDPKRE
jgi:hypothetical protein